MVTLSQKDMRGILRHRCDEAGGQRAWAKAHSFAEPYVSQMLSGKKAISDSVARAMGYQKKEYFVACQDGEASA